MHGWFCFEARLMNSKAGVIMFMRFYLLLWQKDLLPSISLSRLMLILGLLPGIAGAFAQSHEGFIRFITLPGRMERW